MKRLLATVLGILIWPACAQAEEPDIRDLGRSFAPIGGLVALAQTDRVTRGSVQRIATVPDSKIAWDVGALLLDPSINARQVVVEVKQQRVTLSGPVENGSQADDAERAARRVAGVSEIQNRMWVP